MKKEKIKKEKPSLTVAQLKKKKARKTRAAISCFVLLLAIGIGGNWYWENSDISNKVSVVNKSNEKVLGEATFVDATTEISKEESKYFSSARLDRQTARDESIEKLQKIIDSADESDSAHKKAAEKIASISDSIAIENKIETLVKAKGVNNCLAIVNEDGTKVDVIIDSSQLNDTLILQIKDIATNQLGCSFNDVTIIQSN